MLSSSQANLQAKLTILSSFKLQWMTGQKNTCSENELTHLISTCHSIPEELLELEYKTQACFYISVKFQDWFN